MQLVEIPLQCKLFQVTDTFNLTIQNESCHMLFGDRIGMENFLLKIKDENCLIIECLESLNHLINELNHLQSSHILNTLIIPNLSWIVWELKIIDKNNWQDYNLAKFVPYSDRLSQLLKTLEAIKSVYKCNVIVLSYDVQFDKGYNFQKIDQIDDTNNLTTYTNLPSNYLMKLDYLIHLDDYSNLRQFDYDQKKWIMK